MSKRHQDVPTEESTFEVVGKRFGEFCRKRELDVLVSAGDKHGSTVWEGGSRNKLNYYIIFALTPDDETPPAYLASITTIADNDTAYSTSVHDRWRYAGLADLQADLQTGHLGGAFDAAWTKVTRLTEPDLTEQYLVPHRVRHAASSGNA